MNHQSYVLITPARNEEQFLGKTIAAVVRQTVLPRKWIIVDDGSIDGTSRLVQEWATRFHFITLIKSLPSVDRNFASKAKAFASGWRSLENLDYDFIGNLDADITFQPNYFEQLLHEFQQNPRLGLAGGLVHELSTGSYRPQRLSQDSVAGAVQTFRRDCFNQIGGYLEIKYGGIDAVAESMARMYGWEVKTFDNLEALHHRAVGRNIDNYVKLFLRQGERDYLIGNCASFYIIKLIYRFFEKPYILNSFLRFTGYFNAYCRRERKLVPEDLVKFLKREQHHKLYTAIQNLFRCFAFSLPG